MKIGPDGHLIHLDIEEESIEEGTMDGSVSYIYRYADIRIDREDVDCALLELDALVAKHGYVVESRQFIKHISSFPYGIIVRYEGPKQRSDSSRVQ
jgi:hypothetical protein